MYEYFVQDRKILHNLDDLGITSKTVSTTSPMTQIFLNALSVFEHASHLRDTWDIILIIRFAT